MNLEATIENYVDAEKEAEAENEVEVENDAEAETKNLLGEIRRRPQASAM
jgi:hypothetical protein